MTAKILQFDGLTTNRLEPDAVLESAKDKLEDVILLGWDKDGELYMAANFSDAAKLIYLMERAKHAFFHLADEE